MAWQSTNGAWQGLSGLAVVAFFRWVESQGHLAGWDGWLRAQLGPWSPRWPSRAVSAGIGGVLVGWGAAQATLSLALSLATSLRGGSRVASVLAWFGGGPKAQGGWGMVGGVAALSLEGLVLGVGVALALYRWPAGTPALPPGAAKQALPGGEG